jgi:hypothetical protein
LIDPTFAIVLTLLSFKKPYASEACCEGQHDVNAERSPHYLYDQERVTFSTAGSRCQAMGMESCDFNEIEGLDSWHKKGYHWTTDSCVIQVKVNAIGQVALVYKPESFEYLVSIIFPNSVRNTFAYLITELIAWFLCYCLTFHSIHTFEMTIEIISRYALCG